MNPMKQFDLDIDLLEVPQRWELDNNHLLIEIDHLQTWEADRLLEEIPCLLPKEDSALHINALLLYQA